MGAPPVVKLPVTPDEYYKLKGFLAYFKFDEWGQLTPILIKNTEEKIHAK